MTKVEWLLRVERPWIEDTERIHHNNNNNNHSSNHNHNHNHNNTMDPPHIPAVGLTHYREDAHNVEVPMSS